MASLVPQLVQAGFRVLTFAHRDCPGKKTNLLEFNHFHRLAGQFAEYKKLKDFASQAEEVAVQF